MVQNYMLRTVILLRKGKLIAKWDPFNAVIITEATGKIEFESVVENVTYKVESDEATGLREIIIIESKDKTKSTFCPYL